MDVNTQSPVENGYQGDSPRWAAIKEFFFSGLLVGVGLNVLLDAGAMVGAKRRGESMLSVFSRERMTTGLLAVEAAVGMLFGGYQAEKAYRQAKRNKAEHDHLVKDNAAMRELLGNTKEILTQVSDKLPTPAVTTDGASTERLTPAASQQLQQ